MGGFSDRYVGLQPCRLGSMCIPLFFLSCDLVTICCVLRGTRLHNAHFRIKTPEPLCHSVAEKDAADDIERKLSDGVLPFTSMHLLLSRGGKVTLEKGETLGGAQVNEGGRVGFDGVGKRGFPPVSDGVRAELELREGAIDP